MPLLPTSAVTISVQGQQQILDLLERTMRKDEADKATLQVFDEQSELLHLIAYKGFYPEFLEHFRTVKAFSGSACGRVIGIGNPVIISDVFLDAALEPHLEIIKAAGYRAVKALPIFSATCKKLGVLSTHFRNIKWSWDLQSIEEEITAFAPVLSAITIHRNDELTKPSYQRGYLQPVPSN